MPALRVRLFAAHREAAGGGEVVLQLPEGATVAALRRELERTLPALRALKASTVVAVNGEFALDDRKVAPDDEVAVFPPVAGG